MERLRRVERIDISSQHVDEIKENGHNGRRPETAHLARAPLQARRSTGPCRINAASTQQRIMPARPNRRDAASKRREAAKCSVCLVRHLPRDNLLHLGKFLRVLRRDAFGLRRVICEVAWLSLGHVLRQVLWNAPHDRIGGVVEAIEPSR